MYSPHQGVVEGVVEALHEAEAAEGAPPLAAVAGHVVRVPALAVLASVPVPVPLVESM